MRRTTSTPLALTRSVGTRYRNHASTENSHGPVTSWKTRSQALRPGPLGRENQPSIVRGTVVRVHVERLPKPITHRPDKRERPLMVTCLLR